MNKTCGKCGAELRFYFIGKDGLCNGCRHPELVVESIIEKEGKENEDD